MNIIYTIHFEPAARRQFNKLPENVKSRMGIAIDSLARNPRPPGAEKLSGRKNYYRIRVGDYRVIYTVEDDRLLVLVVRVGARKDVYRKR